MCKKAFDWITVFVALSTILLLGLCGGLIWWMKVYPHPALGDWILSIVYEIIFMSLIVCGLKLPNLWKNSLGFEKLIIIIVYAAFFSIGVATLCYLFAGPDSNWLSGFFLSISVGLITGLVIYFLTNIRRQNEREVEDEVKILQETKDSYNNVCLFLFFEQKNRDAIVGYKNPFGEFPDLVNGFMTNIDKLSYSTLLQIKKTKNPKKGEDSEKQDVLNIISNFSSRIYNYIETYAKTANSDEVENLSKEFQKELIILETFVDTKLDESQKTLRRIKYSMF